MIDVLRPPPRPVSAAGPPRPFQRSSLALELRVLAEEMAGRVDRDELTIAEEEVLAVALDETVEAMLPRICVDLEAELGPRIESLPLHARVALVNARRRRLLGLD
jgi:hypothetical protein